MFAALLVFLYHFPITDTGLLAVVSREGHVGVTVFFVLSGFLITSRYLGPLTRREIGLSDYFRKRMARILPLYWVVLALSLLLSPGGLEFSARTLPEWTLTQGFLSPSLHHLIVPTSWTLTLEECFYAMAPLIFWTLAAARVPAWASLLGWTGALFGLGMICLQLAQGSGLGLLSSVREIVTHTIFGRFVDFAIGIGAALLLARVSRLWIRPRGPALAALGALASVALLILAEHGMTRAGGIEGAAWAAAWKYNLLVAVASATLILCLTCRASLVSRALELRPLVYMGRISYALYLIQMSPLGKGLLYRLLPGGHPMYVPMLYLGMNAISALLFELVEEPGRRAVLSVWRGRERREATTRPVMPWARRSVLMAVLLGSVALQAGTWAAAALHRRYGQPSLAEVDAALGPSGRVLTMTLPPVAEGKPPARRVALPDGWMLGTEPDRRAPTSLLVFLEGHPVPFSRRAPERGLDADDAPQAYFKRPKTAVLDLHLAEAGPSEIAVVRNDVWARLLLQQHRLQRSPLVMAMLVIPILAALAIGWLLERRRFSLLKVAAVAAAAGAALWMAGDVHHRSGASYALAGELAAIALLPTLRRGLALDRQPR